MYIHRILEKIKNLILQGKIDRMFFLLSGPKNTGKFELLKKTFIDITHFRQDILILEDLSKYGYNSTIKVDQEEIVEINGEKKILYGSRQIIDFLSTNPVDKKIVFLENMERMTNSAFNALLKIFEELPKNVYVLSTTSNIGFIPDTILSRAFILNFFSSSFKNFRQEIKKMSNMSKFDEEKISSLYYLTNGNLNKASFFIKFLDKVKKIDMIDSYFDKLSILKEIIQEYGLENLVNYLLIKSDKLDMESYKDLLNLSKMVFENRLNLNIENFLLYLCLKKYI